MSFLNPAMLIGLLAVAVPLVIHLLFRRRFRCVSWAAMRFLLRSAEQNRRRIQLQNLLLLVLRCALLCLLALVFARPVWRGRTAPGSGLAPVTAALVLDNSASMSCSDGVRSRFDNARQIAEQILDSLPPRSTAALYLASDTARGVVPQPISDLNRVRKMIRDSHRTDRATDLLPAVREATDVLLQQGGLRKELYVLTDDQAVGWRQMEEIQRLLHQHKNHIRTFVVFVGPVVRNNLSITGLRLAHGLPAANQPLRFEAEVTNFGADEANNVPIRLRLGNQPPADQAVIKKLPARTTATVSLYARLPSAGYHAVTAELPADRMPADDTRTIVLHAHSEVNILLVDGNPGHAAGDSDVFYLRHALVPVPALEAERYFIRTTVIAAAQLGSVRWDEYDAVILANVGGFTQRTARALKGYLQRGGAAILFLGDNVDAPVYNHLLLDHEGFLPARLGSLRDERTSGDGFFTLQQGNYDHPVVELWNDPAAGTLGSARFYRAFQLEPVSGSTLDGATGIRVLLRFADGSPAVVEGRCGRGRVVLFASTANTAWNDLPLRPSFVPLLHRLLGELLRQDERVNFHVGDSVVLPVADDLIEKPVQVHFPPQAAWRVSSRQIALLNGSAVLRFDETDWNGAYDATMDSDTEPVARFAAGMDPAESDLQVLSAQQVATLSAAADILHWTPQSDLKQVLAGWRCGIELSAALAGLLLVLAVAESMLMHWFSRSR